MLQRVFYDYEGKNVSNSPKLNKILELCNCNTYIEPLYPNE